MSDVALPPLAVNQNRFAKWTRIVVVAFAVIALLALSFALGRVTMEHTQGLGKVAILSVSGGDTPVML